MNKYTFTRKQLQQLLLDTLTAFENEPGIYNFSERGITGEDTTKPSVIKNIINTLNGIAANVDEDNVSESALGLESVF